MLSKTTFKQINLLTVIAVLLITISTKAQTFAWAKQAGGANCTTSTSMGVINTDSFGNMYLSVSGSATIDVDPGPAVVNTTGGLVKYGPSGNFLWVKQIPAVSAIDAAGNIYCTGSFSGTRDFDPGSGVYNLTSFGYDDISILKFDVNGNLIWAKQVGGSFMERSGGLAVSADRIFITGGFGYGGNVSPINSCDFNPDPVTTYNLTNVGSWDGFVLSLDLEGQFIAVSQIGTTASETANYARCDNAGNIIYLITDTVMRLQKMDAGLNLLWSVGIFNNGMNISPISLDPAGNVLISGGYIGTSDFDPGPGVTMVPSVNIWGTLVQAPFVEKIDANGNFLWVRTLNANGFATGVTSDSAGNVYTVGNFNSSGNVDFDPGLGIYNFKVSDMAGYVQKLSPAGSFVWAAKLGGESKTKTFGRAIALNNSNDVFTTFEFSGTIDVDPGSAKFTMKAIGTKDVMLHKMSQSIAAIQRVEEAIVSELKSFKAYPNPNNGNFYVDIPKVGENARLEIYTLSGQVILRKAFNGKYDQRLLINKDISATGMYLLQVIGRDRTFNTKITIQ